MEFDGCKEGDFGIFEGKHAITGQLDLCAELIRQRRPPKEKMTNLQLAYEKIHEANKLLETEGANFAEDDRHAIYVVRCELLGAALNVSTLVRQEPIKRKEKTIREQIRTRFTLEE